MNYSTAVFLINNHVRAIRATYDVVDGAKETTFKTLDETIAVNDYIIVPTDTRHKMTVCKVTEVDIDLDFDTTEQVDWMIGRVDTQAYDQTLKDEASAITAIKAAERRRKRDDLRANMFADHVETLKALPITDLNGDLDKV